ncbi:DUF6461 domain-containing protein [Streptomyces sp. MB09-01]|uniref:DUF6461 domain-containing protein n=1 Tax=Streptomyces sp. MB09-01 TaxID=3028666 RepID=UPI0029B6B199|nr:DUF6461 domain-containing protein [Streptomyces sp. MB09-01]MDX3540014.1 DUF6461 domain-containing protein [Streptomyces sp. MB09-01]
MSVLEDGLTWLPSSFPQGFSVLFARDVEPRTLLELMGCEEGSFQVMDRDDAEEFQHEDPEERSVLRAGSVGPWSFAVQSWGAHVLESDALQHVSAVAETVAIVRTETIPWFAYAKNGQTLCSFDPGLPDLRDGADRDILLSHMVESGLRVEGRDSGISSVDAMLGLAERAFGLGLPRELVVDGELLAGVAEATP